MDEEEQNVKNLPQETESEDKKGKTRATMTALSPLVSILLFGPPICNILLPLICWLLWKDDNPLVDRVGKNILNTQISYDIYLLVASLSLFFLVGIVLLPVVFIAWIVFSLIAAVKTANEDYDYKAPFTISFLK